MKPFIDYYKILEINSNATKEEIKISYRKLAMLHHPDRNKGSIESENKFKEIVEAYSILNNYLKRKEYDLLYKEHYRTRSTHHSGQHSSDYTNTKNNHNEYGSKSSDTSNNDDSGQSENSEDNFDSFDNDSTTSEASYNTYHIYLNFWEAILGGEKIIEILFQGNREYIKFIFPPATENGQIFRLSLANNEEILIKITVEDDPYYIRDNLDLYTKINIPLSKAILGGEMPFEHWEKIYTLKIPPGTQHGDKIRVSNAGIKKDIFIGDLYLLVQIPIPKKLTKEQKEIIELYSTVEDDSPSIFQGIKDTWNKFKKH